MYWQRKLERWTQAGVIDAATAERIRAFELAHEESSGLRWLVLVFIGLGGVLLFVAAHWDDMSPKWRFILAQAMLLLSITYISALRPGAESATHKALAWLGCLTLIPAVWAVLESAGSGWGYRGPLPEHYRAIGWALVLVVPLGLAGWSRRGAMWMNAVAALWVIGLGIVAPSYWGMMRPRG